MLLERLLKIRFRFKVEVFDGQDSAVFLLFDLEAELLAGFSCEKILNTIEIEKKVIHDGDYPYDIEERLAGKEMLFKVCNNSRVKHDRDDCFQILRICKVLSPFSELDITGEDGEISLNVTGEKSALAGSNAKDKGPHHLRKKLLIDFEPDEEDDAGLAGRDDGTFAKISPLSNMARDANGEGNMPDAIQSQTDAKGTVNSAVETGITSGVVHEPKTPMFGVELTTKNSKGLFAVKIEATADAGAVPHEGANCNSGLKSMPLFGEESIEAPLTMNSTKKNLKIEVSHVEVEEVLNKMVDDSHIIVISDDEDDVGA
ncbi:uncharacterized protein LOC130712051 isoform X2 [Lotus japonicus]|uniref:uncharacterized protein LOC130712051 isoform X2 n=1 Tax=Lotus japonicus TaxID=34305 RepID=UPI0025910DE6|nr:uncharacterized protein LOC130712051 isoform X2 [Lotus japonicus]